MDAFGRDAKPVEPSPRGPKPKAGPTPWEVMERQLQRDENLIWADRSADLMAHAKTRIVQSVFGIPFLAFAIFWTSMATSMTSSINDDGIGSVIDAVFPLFGWVFILVGAGLVLSPAIAAFRAHYVIYGATNKRLIIRSEFPSTSVRSFRLEDLEPLERTGPDEGPGNLYFAKDIHNGTNKRGVTISKVGFIGINDPLRLEQEVEVLRSAARKR